MNYRRWKYNVENTISCWEISCRSCCLCKNYDAERCSRDVSHFLFRMSWITNKFSILALVGKLGMYAMRSVCMRRVCMSVCVAGIVVWRSCVFAIVIAFPMLCACVSVCVRMWALERETFACIDYSISLYAILVCRMPHRIDSMLPCIRRQSCAVVNKKKRPPNTKKIQGAFAWRAIERECWLYDWVYTANVCVP